MCPIPCHERRLTLTKAFIGIRRNYVDAIVNLVEEIAGMP